MPESVFFPGPRIPLMLARVVSPLIVLVLAFSLSTVACAGAVPGTIGAKLGQRPDGRLFVREAPAGEGAAQAGLELDDEILAIDGRPVRGMTEEDVRRSVRGEAGSVMTLRVERAGVARDVKVKRSPRILEKK